jgi:hypothetical protein
VRVAALALLEPGGRTAMRETHRRWLARLTVASA